MTLLSLKAGGYKRRESSFAEVSIEHGKCEVPVDHPAVRQQ